MATASNKIVVVTAQEEELAAGEYAVWSPYDAHEAAATLMQLLEQEKAEATQIQVSRA